VRRRFLIIHNPHAGMGRKRLLANVISRLESAGAKVVVQTAASAAATSKLAEKASRTGAYDAIAAAGGDGTIRDVAMGLRGSTVPLGIVPVGTGNVMAHEIGLERRSRAIAHYLLHGEAAPLSPAAANGQPFFLMAGVGFDARAVAALDPAVKKRWGKLAYFWPVARALLRPLPRLDAQIDGENISASWVVITKAHRYGGSFVLSPKSSVLDGKLHAAYSHAQSRLGLARDLMAIARGDAAGAPHLTIIQCNRALIGADTPEAVEVDGEVFGQTPLEIVSDPQSLMILLPKHQKRLSWLFPDRRHVS
jgi:diacylglycerol kinase (ATP)